MSEIDKYPKLKQLIIDIAACNGLINRLEPSHLAIEKAERALFADGVLTQDVVNLETWLTGLTEDQFDTLADGEESEMEAIADSAPVCSTGSETVAMLIRDAYEEMIG